MRGAVMYAPGDVRVEDRPEPTISEADRRRHPARRRPASAAPTCGPTAASTRSASPSPMGHEYVGIVEEVGSEVTTITPGQFVVGSFFASDNTCEICQAGYQTLVRPPRDPRHRGGAQAQRMRVPLADGTLVATPEVPPADLSRHFLAASDVLGTGWFGAVAAEVGPGKTVAVVGDGAVGLLRRAGRPAARRRTHHRDEPPRGPPAAGARVRRHRHRHRTRRRRRRTHQGAHRRPRRAQRHRGGRHPGSR